MKLWVSVLGLGLASVLSAEEATGPAVTPYGMVQYRFREEIKMKTTDGEANSSLTNYLNTVGYKFGSKIKVNEKVSFQFEIANDWNATEAVNLAAWNYAGKRLALNPYFTLAMVALEHGSCHINAGIVPVQSTAAAALLGASLTQDRKYNLAAHLPWATLTSGGIPGFRVGGPVLTGDVKVGMDVLTSIVEERPVAYSPDDPVSSNNSAVMVNLDIPVKLGSLSLTPQVFAIPNRNFRDAGSENQSDMEVIGGVEAGYKVNDGLSVRTGFATGMISNENTADTLAQYDRNGVLGSIGATIKAGPGKLDLEAAVSQASDAKSAASDATYPFFDARYGYPLGKNFVVTPRVRVFVTSAETYSVNHVRPEMIFTGSF